ncbi:MAG: MFS transporter [Bdellovibrionota bacterium]
MKSNTRWIALFSLTTLNILNYIDRNIFSALAPAIQREFSFTDTQLGLLGSGFIFAYTFVSPVFGTIGDRGNRSRTMAGGVILWSAATAWTGLTTSFIGQMIARISVGLGEAAYSVIAPTVVADFFSRTSRGKVFAIYSCAIPVGSALGYVIAGILEPRFGWKQSFFFVGVPGLVLAFVLFFLKDPPRGGSDDPVVKDLSRATGIEAKDDLSVVSTYKMLFKNGGFMLTVLGYSAYTFVVGGLAFWMPTYIVRYFPEVTMAHGNMVFGGIMVVGGFIGTIVGGWWSDHIEKKSGNGYLKVCFYSMMISVPLFFYALTFKDFKTFSIVLFFLDIALFLGMSPLDAAIIAYVRPKYRATGLALTVFLIHALGDGISRVLMGVVSDSYGLRAAVMVLPWGLFIAGLFWAAVFILYWQTVPLPKNALKIPRRQAHRGFRPTSSVQENTLAAFRLARENGAEMTECDVQVSSDGVVVVFHDYDLKRLGGGSSDFVSQLTAADLLSRANAGTLEALLTDADSPRLVNIELKSRELFGKSGLERALVEVVNRVGASERVMVSSFNPFALRRMSKFAPDIPRALLVTGADDKDNAIYLRKAWLAFWARPHILNQDANDLTPKVIQGYADRGVPVIAWTVNEESRARELEAAGVMSVITDRLFR